MAARVRDEDPPAAVFVNPEKLPELESRLHRLLGCRCKGDIAWHERQDAAGRRAS